MGTSLTAGNGIYLALAAAAVLLAIGLRSRIDRKSVV